MTPPLFNSRLRARHRRLGSALLLLAAALPYGLAFAALQLRPGLEFSRLGTALAGLTLLISAALPWLLQGRLALVGNRGLWEALRRRLGPEARGRFVGFSPGPDLLSWEGETDEDIGFLELVGNTLVYRGDRHSFSLRRESVDDVHLLSAAGESAPPLGPLRVAVYWHGPGDPGRVFTLAAREAHSLRQANRGTRALAERLGGWWREGQPEADEIPLLGPPPTDVRGGVPLDRPAPGSCLSALSVAIIVASLAWYQAGGLVREGHYNRALLWAGLLVVVGMVLTAQVLAYLQSQAGRREPREDRPRR